MLCDLSRYVGKVHVGKVPLRSRYEYLRQADLTKRSCGLTLPYELTYSHKRLVPNLRFFCTTHLAPHLVYITNVGTLLTYIQLTAYAHDATKDSRRKP